MTPSYATKNGVRYRYYVSSALFHGQQGEAGELKRIPAAEIETLIANAIRSRLTNQVRCNARSRIDFNSRCQT